jgi:hypothetical protein
VATGPGQRNQWSLTHRVSADLGRSPRRKRGSVDAGGAAATRAYPWTPDGVAACSRWLSVVCDTTGSGSGLRTPAGVLASNANRQSKGAGAPAGVPCRGANFLFECPVVSQTALNHRLHAAIPTGIKTHSCTACASAGSRERPAGSWLNSLRGTGHAVTRGNGKKSAGRDACATELRKVIVVQSGAGIPACRLWCETSIATGRARAWRR